MRLSSMVPVQVLKAINPKRNAIFFFCHGNSWRYIEVKEPRDDKCKDHTSKQEIQESVTLPEAWSLCWVHRCCCYCIICLIPLLRHLGLICTSNIVCNRSTDLTGPALCVKESYTFCLITWCYKHCYFLKNVVTLLPNTANRFKRPLDMVNPPSHSQASTTPLSLWGKQYKETYVQSRWECSYICIYISQLMLI